MWNGDGSVFSFIMMEVAFAWVNINIEDANDGKIFGQTNTYTKSKQNEASGVSSEWEKGETISVLFDRLLLQ